MKKTAIYYDSLLSIGGAERMVLSLAEKLNADVITSGFNPDLLNTFNTKVNVINIGNFSIKYSIKLGTLIEQPLRFYFCSLGNRYDINLFVGYTSIFAAKKGLHNIWYCMSPNRALYDLKEYKLQQTGKVSRLLLNLYANIFTPLDQHWVKNKFSKIISQTKTVQKRVKKYYGLSSKVIYSPVNTDKYSFSKFGDFYLAVSRLTPEKRMDLIADAFITMHDKKLVLVGDGPMKNKIKQTIKNHKNIKLYSSISDKKLSELYSNCLASIYMPMEEDYGMVPIEGMASGKGCIAVNEGGCRETVINGRTGFLIAPTVEDISKVVNSYDKKLAKSFKKDCLAQSEKFSTDQSIMKWRKEITT